MKLKVPWASLLVVFIFVNFSKAGLSPRDEQLIDDYILEILDCLSIPGSNLAVVQNGEVLMSKGYGKADLEEDVDVTSETRFNIASTSKAFTAVLLAQLLSEDEG